MFMAGNARFLEEIANNPEYWIGDTGASTHITMSDKGMEKLRIPEVESTVVMANGEKLAKEGIGTVKGFIVSNDGNYIGDIAITSVNVTPKAKYNLLSIITLMRDGWKLEGKVDSLSLTKDKQKIVFDIKIPTAKEKYM